MRPDTPESRSWALPPGSSHGGTKGQGKPSDGTRSHNSPHGETRWAAALERNGTCVTFARRTDCRTPTEPMKSWTSEHVAGPHAQRQGRRQVQARKSQRVQLMWMPASELPCGGRPGEWLPLGAGPWVGGWEGTRGGWDSRSRAGEVPWVCSLCTTS